MAHVKTLTPTQLTVLRELAERGNLPRSTLMAAAGIGHNTMATVVESLEYLGLVIEGERPKGRALCLLQITDAGHHALANPDVAPATRVVPPARRVVSVPILPQAPYYRNAGHRHIHSRGVAC